jgi:hypothetical protein
MARHHRARLTDEELDRLGHGSIVCAEVYNSFENNAAGPHYCIILDTDEQVRRSTRYRVVVISHNDVIDPRFLMPVPATTGLDGSIVGSWTTHVDEAGVREIRPRLSVPQMAQVLALVRQADAAGPLRRRL